MQDSERQTHLPADGGPLSSQPAAVPAAKVTGALAVLVRACAARGSALSVGLEPCAAHLPPGFDPTIAGYERFLNGIVSATSDVAAAFKFNLAFFEALGPAGIDLLHRVRTAMPSDAYVIADAKRGDIGTTAEHYARALFDGLGAHAATVNPLMGRDAVEPFLAHADRLTFVLALTSNPGAADFLLPEGLYARIARAALAWNTRGNVGLVVGATRAEKVAEIRAIAGSMPMLIPGIGAQGGELESTAQRGRTTTASDGAFAGLLFHVTRGVLPARDEPGDPFQNIRRRATAWRDAVNAAVASRGAAHAHPATTRSAAHAGL